jgi:dTDP-4-amino-4,6-dideoxygalactose transaminase
MWKKHKARHGENSNDLVEALERWQNKLPLYNLRLSNMSAAIVRSQLPEVARRVRDGRRNHDHVATMIERSPWMTVPSKLAAEERAPDSLQFNLVGLSDEETRAFQDAAAAQGVKVQVFGLSTDNARAFWNWQFLGELPDLPKTRAMLMRACDTRLPARLTLEQCEVVAEALVAAAEDVMGEVKAYGT